MTDSKKVVLDANILVRAVLGKRVGEVLEVYGDSAAFCTPDHCVEEARRSLAVIALRRSS